MSSEPFPKLPKPALTKEILTNLLDDARRKGLPVFIDDYGRFVIETSTSTQATLEIVDGRCSVHFKNTLGPNKSRIAVETPDQLKEALERITRPEPKPGRALVTVLFTDIVDSTRRAAEMGDGPWRELLAKHDALIRKRLTEFSGREIDTAGDGFFATFDAPSLGVLAACAITTDIRSLGLEVRAGLHTGEVETDGMTPTGINVHIGARVKELAAGGEVLVSKTVKELVTGSGIRFTDRGAHALKGVPEESHLFAVDQGSDVDRSSGQKSREAIRLSNPARELLLTATQSPDGKIIRFTTHFGPSIQSNRRVFNEGYGPRETARWEAALRELESSDLVEVEGLVFTVTNAMKLLGP
jgi:class 3 adenylate cyclase